METVRDNELLRAAEAYMSECENPAPDYLHRRHLREHLFATVRAMLTAASATGRRRWIMDSDPFGEVLESFRADLRHYISTMYPNIKTTAVISIINHAAAAARIAFVKATEDKPDAPC